MRMSEVMIALLIFAIVTATVFNVSFSVIRNSKSSVECSNNNLLMLETDMKIRNCIHSVSFSYWKAFELYESTISSEISMKLKELGVDVLKTQTYSRGRKYFIQITWKSGNRIVSTVDSISNYKIID